MPRQSSFAPSSFCVSLVALALAAASACSSAGPSGDQTTKFSGAWTFASGQLAPTCSIAAGLPPFDLAGLDVTFTKIDDATISLTINATCDVHFHVSGDSGTVLANQTCALDLGGVLGMQNIMVTKWTLALAGDQIDCAITGQASFCSAAGTGVLVRRTADAGVTDGAAGHDGGSLGAAGAGGIGSDAGADADATADAAGPETD
jgi:hypothetical protein